MHHDSRPRKHMTVFRGTQPISSTKPPAPSSSTVKMEAVGQMVGGVWVAK